MKALLQFVLAWVCIAQTVSAQTYQDFALRYNPASFGGTSRIQAMGGAQVSLGGDLSSISGNPAGLGFYNRSDFGVTGSLIISANTTEYNGDTDRAIGSGLRIPNVGLVIKLDVNNSSSRWRTHALGFSVNQQTSFRNRVTYESRVTDSLGDFTAFALQEAENLLGQSNSNDVARVLEGNLSFLAWQTFLINGVFDNNENLAGFSSEVFAPSQPFPTRQRESINERGGLTSTNISWGGNYNDVFYIGAGASLLSVNHTISREFTETFNDNVIDRFQLDEDRDMSGFGFNARAGIIVRPVPFITIGANAQTPTILSLQDRSDFFARADYNQFPVQAPDPELVFEYEESYRFGYQMIIPGRIDVGSTVFIGKQGFVTGDVTYVNHSLAQLSSNEYSFNEENEQIDSIYNAVLNYRIGGEMRLGSFRLRAGGGVLANPVENSLLEAERTFYSLGAGIRKPNFYFDAAFTSVAQQSMINAFPGAPFAMSDGSINTLNVTFGVLF